MLVVHAPRQGPDSEGPGLIMVSGRPVPGPSRRSRQILRSSVLSVASTRRLRGRPMRQGLPVAAKGRPGPGREAACHPELARYVRAGCPLRGSRAVCQAGRSGLFDPNLNLKIAGAFRSTGTLDCAIRGNALALASILHSSSQCPGGKRRNQLECRAPGPSREPDLCACLRQRGRGLQYQSMSTGSLRLRVSRT
jgi:hypothetical protein